MQNLYSVSETVTQSVRTNGDPGSCFDGQNRSGRDFMGGVVGEDGVENLKREHDFPGNVHLTLGCQLVTLPKAVLV